MLSTVFLYLFCFFAPSFCSDPTKSKLRSSEIFGFRGDVVVRILQFFNKFSEIFELFCKSELTLLI